MNCHEEGEEESRRAAEAAQKLATSARNAAQDAPPVRKPSARIVPISPIRLATAEYIGDHGPQMIAPIEKMTVSEQPEKSAGTSLISDWSRIVSRSPAWPRA